MKFLFVSSSLFKLLRKLRALLWYIKDLYCVLDNTDFVVKGFEYNSLWKDKLYISFMGHSNRCKTWTMKNKIKYHITILESVVIWSIHCCNSSWCIWNPVVRFIGCQEYSCWFMVLWRSFLSIYQIGMHFIAGFLIILQFEGLKFKFDAWELSDHFVNLCELN